MAEQRLIDANKFAEAWNQDSQIGKTMRAVIAEQPTINPESLPIVKELQEQLEKVTAERDKIKQMAKETCEFCMSLTRRSGLLPGCEICPLNGLRRRKWKRKI